MSLAVNSEAYFTLIRAIFVMRIGRKYYKTPHKLLNRHERSSNVKMDISPFLLLLE